MSLIIKEQHLSIATEFKKGILPWNKGKKCPQISLRQMGKKNHRWKNGATSLYIKIRNSTEHKDWSRSVLLRDNFECQLCGRSGGVLHANHIKKFADYPSIRFDLNNGVTLCKSCHISMVNNHEKEWESYFNFNLETRGILNEYY